MAFFKILRGNRSGLNDLAKNDGYVYFCTDDGSLHIDYIDENGSLQRKQITIQNGDGSLNWNGTAWFAGDVRVGGTNYDNANPLCTQDDISGKQNTSNDLTIVPGTYGQTVNLDGKTQHYYLEFKNFDDEFNEVVDTVEGVFEINCYNLEKDEHTFYLYINVSCEKFVTLRMLLNHETEEGDWFEPSVTWIEEPTIDYPHTKMLLAFKTIDGGKSWVANQCYSMEVTN
jgi:hypothetical protein